MFQKLVIQKLGADTGCFKNSRRRIGCQEVKLLSVLRTKITSVTSLPSCPPNFCSSDNNPLPQSLPQGREAEKRASLLTIHTSLKKQAAFTLAEVLITLGIIGIVAAMTLPSLVANYKEKEIITKAKKDYSIIMQAFQFAQSDSGAVDNSYLYTGASSANDVATVFAKYIPGGYLCLSTSKDKLCKDLNYSILYSDYKNLFGNVYPPAIILPDNGVLFFTLSEYQCVSTLVTGNNLDADGNIIYNPDGSPSKWSQTRNNCGSIIIDVNGPKSPNKFGYDAFGIEIYPDKIGKNQWNVYGADSLFSILAGGKLKYNTNK